MAIASFHWANSGNGPSDRLIFVELFLYPFE